MSEIVADDPRIELVFAPEPAVVLVQSVPETTVLESTDNAVVVTVDTLPVEVLTPEEVAHVIETAGTQGPPGPSTNEAFDLDLNAVYQIAKL